MTIPLPLPYQRTGNQNQEVAQLLALLTSQATAINALVGALGGPSGGAGLSALDGADGDEGWPIPGPAGANGAPGSVGPQGMIGIGLDGADADDLLHLPGPPGAAGSAGPVGPQGIPGIGIDGADADDLLHLPGPAGAAGAQGPAGPQGIIGIGLDGFDGDEGMPVPGPQGIAGPQGLQGLQGIPGIGFDGADADDLLHIPGQTGSTGATGAQGIPGIGLDGADPDEGVSVKGTPDSVQGNLVFASAGQRIIGDFSNGTNSNRPLFQTSTLNGNTAVGVIPNGTAGQGAFRVYSTSDPNNASIGVFAASNTNGIVINSILTGIGLQLPIQFQINAVTKAQVLTGGDFNTVAGVTDTSYSYQTPVTGFSIVIANNVQTLILDPLATLATGTITMPTAPNDGQIIKISSSQTITALTVSPNTGQSIKNAPTIFTVTLTGDQGYEFIYRAANTTWYRLQ